MTKSKPTLNVLAVAIVAAIAAGCTHGPATGHGAGHGPGHWGMGPGMMGSHGPGMMGGQGPGGLWGLERLDLSPQQRADIGRIQDEFAARHDALMRSMHERGDRHHGMMFDDGADRRSYDEMATLHKEMFEMHLQARQRILGVLTPAQREQLGRGRPGS